MFPVNVNSGGNWPNAWYPWEAQDLKDLKKAIAENGPNSLWVEIILQGLACQFCTARDWRDLARAMLIRSFS